MARAFTIQQTKGSVQMKTTPGHPAISGILVRDAISHLAVSPTYVFTVEEPIGPKAVTSYQKRSKQS